MLVTGLLITLLFSMTGPSWVARADAYEANGVFDRFSRHIQRQVESDKIAFAKASGCTNWFYRQEKQKPARPEAQPIALQSPSKEDCLRDYPGGLEAVRQDFHKTQTSLSVSLTFYEFALVGDRDDDAHYSTEELGDLFQSLALAYDPSHSVMTQASALTDRFDSWYRARNLESLMNGMGQLYEKGYRVSAADRVELDRVTQ